jgi:iron complex outermembrane recepter protein
MAISSSNYPAIICASIVWIGIAAMTTKPALGAAAEDSSPSSDSALSEIVVTATRRAERLQDVPMSITALSGVELTRRGANDVNDIIANSPGLSNPAQGLGTNNNLIIRGVATGAGTSNSQSTVSFMLDDIDLNPGVETFGNANPKILDLQQVEILRGPQGTLFGAGSLSGVVRYISNKPDLDKFSGSVEATGSSTDHGGGPSEAISGVLNAPLIDGKLAARLVAYYNNDAGWVDNGERGLSNVNETHTYGARFLLSAKPTDELSVIFTAMDDRTDELGSSATFYFAQPGLPNYKTEQPYYSVGSAELNTHIYNLLMTWTPTWGTLTSTTNYFDRFVNQTQDLGAVIPAFGLPFPGEFASAPSVAPTTAHDFSQEFRFDSPQMGPVRFTTGAFYQRVASNPTQTITSDSPVAPLIAAANITTVQWQAALYGSATYTVADRIDFTAGVRVSKDVVHFNTVEDGLLAGANSTGSEVDKPVTPRAAITFRQTNDLTWYVQAAKGYRVGGPNATAGNDAPASYGPDSLWNYELGSKARLLDGTLNLNTSLYDIEWSNMQVGLVTPQGFDYIGNGGKARIYGLEEEMTLRATRWLELGGTVSVDHAATTSAAAISRVSFGAFGPAPDLEPNAATTNGVLSGYRLPGSPEVQGSLYGEARFPLLNYEAYVRLSGQYVGSAYTDFDSKGLKFGDYTVGNLRAGMKFPHLDVIAFVNNFTNSSGLTSAEDLTMFNVPNGFRVRPRTVGLTLRASF